MNKSRLGSLIQDTRVPGACTQCVRSKRKVVAFILGFGSGLIISQCDQREPQCTRCERRGIACERRNFKPWKRKGWRELCRNGEPTSETTDLSLPAPIPETIPSSRASTTVQEKYSAEQTQQPMFEDLCCVATRALDREPIAIQNTEPDTPHHELTNNKNYSASSPLTSQHDSLMHLGQRNLGPEVMPLHFVLPDLFHDIQGSKSRLFLWQYFVEISSHSFRCWKIPNSRSSPGDLSSALLSVAAFDPTLQSAILAFSADCYNNVHAPKDSMILPQQFRLEALKGLISKRRQCEATRTANSVLPALATSLLLYRYEIDSRVYLLGLARSAAALIRATCSSPSPDYQALAALLVWSEICSNFSLSPQPLLQIKDGLTVGTIANSSLTHDQWHPYNDWLTHPIYGFSSRLVGPLLRMGRLIQARRSQDTWTDEMEIYVDELEVELLNAQFADHEVIRDHPGDPQDLLHVNQAMHAAATIVFYTRLRDQPFTSTLIRKNVERVQREAFYVEPDSLSSRALVFPLYIAGCEAVDGNMRQLISGRVSEYKDYAAVHPQEIKSQLLQVWEIRDQNPGLTWFQWSEQACAKFMPLFIF